MFKKYILFLLVSILTSNTLLLGQTNDYTSSPDTATINNSIRQIKINIYITPAELIPIIDTVLESSEKLAYYNGLYEGNSLKGIAYWMQSDYHQAYFYYKKALYYSSFLPDPKNKAIALSNIGMYYTQIYELDSAKNYLLETSKFCKENNIIDIELKAKYDLGSLYLRQDKYLEAIECIYQVKDSLKIHENKKLELFVYSTLGILYLNIGKHDLAIKSFKQSILIDEEFEGIDVKSSNYINIGQSFFQDLKMDSAYYYYNKALDYALPHNKNKTSLAVNVNLGNIFLHKKELDSCYTYYQKALQDTLIHSYPNYLAAITVDMGLYYTAIKDYTKSKEYLTSGLQMTRELNLVSFEKNALKSLYQMDSTAGNFSGAFQYLIEYNNAKDKLEKEEAKLAIEALEFDNYLSDQLINTHKLEFKNELQAKQIKNKNILIIASLTFVALLLVLIYFIYQARIRTNKLVSELSKKNNMLRQMNSGIQATNLLLAEQEQKLQKLNLTKDKFFAILGHDLKSPFNSLLGLLDILDVQWNEIEDSKKHFLIKKLHTSSQKTYTLLENILSWGKAQQGQIVSQKEKFLLSEKMQSIVELYQSHILSKEIKLLVDVGDQTYLNTDAMLFHQIIQNFVNNAIKFTHKGGQIHIKSTVIGDTIKICVTDTGIGIPESEIGTIFKISTSFNRTGTDDEESTGMGLILAIEYAKILKGRLSATSTEFKGSSFCMEIAGVVVDA